MTNKSFLLILLCFCYLGCDNVIIDNSSSETVNVLIDQEVISLPPSSFEKIKLSEGVHQLKVTDVTGTVLRNSEIMVDEGGLINVGGGEYLYWKVLYGMQNDRQILLNESWLELDSIKYFGDFKIFPDSQVYIESRWDFGIDENLPDAKRLLILKDFEVLSKVFRIEEFKKEYKKMASRG